MVQIGRWATLFIGYTQKPLQLIFANHTLCHKYKIRTKNDHICTMYLSLVSRYFFVHSGVIVLSAKNIHSVLFQNVYSL